MKAALCIDVAKRKHQVELLCQDTLRRKSIPNTPAGFDALLAWIEKHQANLGIRELHVCMEATGTYFEPLAEFLIRAGYRVSVVNPARIASYAKSKLARGKTDTADAALIARFCMEQNPEPWQPLPSEIKQLQALMRHLDVLKQTRQDQQNRLDTAVDENVRTSFEQLIEAINVQIEQTQRLINKHVDDYPELKHRQDLLCTIPGVAWLTALHLLAEIPPSVWASTARQVAAFAGLTPKPVVSGDRALKRTRLCKTGNARLRKTLFMPAICARHHNPILKQFGDRLAAHGKANMVVIGAVMRKLLHHAFGVLKHDLPFDPAWQARTAFSS